MIIIDNIQLYIPIATRIIIISSLSAAAMSEKLFGGEENSSKSRRTVLKTAGTMGLGSLAIPGMTSADANWNFVLSVDYPMMFQKNEAPLDPNDAGVVEGQRTGNGIVIPGDVQERDCGFFGNCDGYELPIPFVIQWTTDAPSYEVGEVIVNMSVETPTATSYDGNGWGYIIEDTETIVESEEAVGTFRAGYDIRDDVPASNLFRPTYITVDVEFRGSGIYDGTLSETMRVTTPNKGLINAENLVQVTSTVYDLGLEAADKTVRLDLDTLSDATRLWAYAQVAGLDMHDPNNLVQNAAIDGISAFVDPIHDQQERTSWGEDWVESMAGPTFYHYG